MSGGAYVQDFDLLSNTGTGIPWVDGFTLSGWYASRSGGAGEVTNYNSGSGTSTAGALYSFGSASSPERALGSVASGTPGDFAYGVRFVNDTGFARTNIAISYIGEQWRAANANVQKLTFFYQVGPSLTDADADGAQPWIPVPTLDFPSPNTNATGALNGNAPTNRVVLTGVVLAGVVVPAGQELFLRWFDPDDAGFDDGLAIDDLAVFFGEALSNPPPAPPVGGLTLVHYNVKGNGASDWSTNAAQVQAIARQLHYLDPDIMTFNEIPNGLRHEMTNWITAFFPGYSLAVSRATDGFIRSAVISRYSIVRSNSWMDGASLTNFGYAGAFTRDLFEAEIAVPGFSQRLHVFTTHLKSGSSPDDQNRRAAEASAISNFFVTVFLATNGLRPYVLTGDFNEDIQIPMSQNNQPIQGIVSAPTGLRLTTPLNPFSFSRFTHSIQGVMDARLDYVIPCTLLFSNIAGSQVFRTDLLISPPPPLLPTDSATASDHLPVVMTFDNPYDRPFRITSFAQSNSVMTVTWESVPGQSYQLEGSPDLQFWEAIGANLLATGSTFTFITNASTDPWFFRVRRE